MARSRNVKPGFFTNELLAELPAFDRLLFVGLWCLADREGRLEDRPKRIKMELFPCDSYDVSSGLESLCTAGFVDRYQVDEFSVVEIVNFTKHQSPHGSEKDSALPDRNGYLTVNERRKNVVIPYKSTKVHIKESLLNVKPPLEVGEPNVPERPDSLIPDSLIPDSLIPDSLIPDSYSKDQEQLPSAVAPVAGQLALVPEKPKRAVKPKTDNQQACSDTWAGYADAYFNRHGTEPVRNAKTNALITQLVQRLGAEAAPYVAAYYVTMNKTYYVSNLHPLGVLVKDCESIHTQWATNRQMTDTRSRQIDQSQANYDVAGEAMKIYNELYAGGDR